MYKKNLFLRSIAYFSLFTVTHTSVCWTVKIVNLTDDNITVDIRSTQLYLGLKAGLPVSRACEFIGKQVDRHASENFDYKDVSPICIAPCTKSVTITSPVQLKAKSTLTSCSNVVVIVRKDASKNWKIEYYDWTDDILRMLEERKRMPVGVREVYDRLGDSPILEISVFRQPIMAGIRELAKALFKDELKQLNYDDLYHTGFIIKCRDQLIRLERNHTVASDIHIIKPENKKRLEQRSIRLPREIRYNEFMSNAMKDDPNFWKYHPIKRNCQLFVLQCLKKNNIEVSDDLHAFIYQDAGRVLSKSPLFKDVAIGVSSLANRIDNMLEKATGANTAEEVYE